MSTLSIKSRNTKSAAPKKGSAQSKTASRRRMLVAFISHFFSTGCDGRFTLAAPDFTPGAHFVLMARIASAASRF
jgi:hypothetical protein